jgi:TonB family protein
MNRFQKKCVIASAGFHLLLILILLVGPAFLSSREPADNTPVIDFIPFKTVDAMVSGGGNPNARPPAPAPAPQPVPPAPAVAAQPTPAPAPTQPPEPPKPAVKEAVKETAAENVRETKIDPESLESNKPAKHKVEVSTKLVKHSSTDLAEARARAEAQARASSEAAEARRRAAAISQAVKGIESGLSGATTIELKGPGGGGMPYANWKQAVLSVYDRAWILPAGASTASSTAAATITIARDGTVLSARVTTRSGNAAVDDSVQAALDRVKYAAPLPDDAREEQRTVTIYFDVKAKLLG